MNRASTVPRPGGLLYGLAAYGLWGLMPLYFRAVRQVSPLELLAHRIVWSVAFLAVVLTLWGRWSKVWACLAHPRTRSLLILSTLLLALNWFVFIYGVATGQVVQNSLGYFINPLLNILLGVLLFAERLRPVQWFAICLAGLGLAYLILSQGDIPWIALVLASSFAGYGVLRKMAPVDALVGLMVETLVLFPLALLLLILSASQGHLSLGEKGPTVDLLLVASGVITTVPLLCFGAAARRLPLTTLGFLQYLAPSLQFLLAVLHLGEPFLPVQQVSFALIWSALALVSVEGLLRKRAQAARASASP